MGNETTSTGIPYIDCASCGIKHPMTRKHCAKCNSPTLFKDLKGLCKNCREVEL